MKTFDEERGKAIQNKAWQIGNLIIHQGRPLSELNEEDHEILAEYYRIAVRSGAPENVLTMLAEEALDTRLRRYLNGNKSKLRSRQKRVQPPTHARFILRLLLSKQELEIIEGDLLESYEKNLKDLGQKRAGWLMHKQIAISVWPFVKRLLYKVGAFAWVTHVVRRLIGG
jgi:uncharacterized protein YeeX (DUF496 family)